VLSVLCCIASSLGQCKFRAGMSGMSQVGRLLSGIHMKGRLTCAKSGKSGKMSSILMAPPALRSSSFTCAMFSSCNSVTALSGTLQVHVTNLMTSNQPQISHMSWQVLRQVCAVDLC